MPQGYRKDGTPSGRRPNTPSDFWAKVAIGASDECWEWTSWRRDGGYGGFSYQGKTYAAHRFAWLLIHGDPGSLCVCHSCDNPPCCNPAHLWLGTHAENMADKESKGRGNQPVGTRNNKAKLTEDQVRTIRSMHASGMTQTAIARIFSLNQTSVSDIVLRYHWAHLP